MQSRSGAVAKLLFVDLIGSVVWFPVWWYTKGLALVVFKTIIALRYRSQSYGFGIWIRNFFVPMYGQHDLVGRIISVFMRFVVLVGRAIAFAVEALIYGIGISLWAVAPVAFAVLAFSSFAAGTFMKKV